MLLSEMFIVICVLNIKSVLIRFFTNLLYFHMIVKAINFKNVLFHNLAINWKNIAKINRNILEYMQMICTIQKMCNMLFVVFHVYCNIITSNGKTSDIYLSLHNMHTQCLLYETHFNWHVLCTSLNFFLTHSVVVLKISEHHISF